jgi:hypothetical protein
MAAAHVFLPTVLNMSRPFVFDLKSIPVTFRKW